MFQYLEVHLIHKERQKQHVITDVKQQINQFESIHISNKLKRDIENRVIWRENNQDKIIKTEKNLRNSTSHLQLSEFISTNKSNSNIYNNSSSATLQVDNDEAPEFIFSSLRQQSYQQLEIIDKQQLNPISLTKIASTSPITSNDKFQTTLIPNSSSPRSSPNSNGGKRMTMNGYVGATLTDIELDFSKLTLKQANSPQIKNLIDPFYNPSNQHHKSKGFTPIKIKPNNTSKSIQLQDTQQSDTLKTMNITDMTQQTKQSQSFKNLNDASKSSYFIKTPSHTLKSSQELNFSKEIFPTLSLKNVSLNKIGTPEAHSCLSNSLAQQQQMEINESKQQQNQDKIDLNNKIIPKELYTILKYTTQMSYVKDKQSLCDLNKFNSLKSNEQLFQVDDSLPNQTPRSAHPISISPYKNIRYSQPNILNQYQTNNNNNYKQDCPLITPRKTNDNYFKLPSYPSIIVPPANLQQMKNTRNNSSIGMISNAKQQVDLVSEVQNQSNHNQISYYHPQIFINFSHLQSPSSPQNTINYDCNTPRIPHSTSENKINKISDCQTQISPLFIPLNQIDKFTKQTTSQNQKRSIGNTSLTKDTPQQNRKLNKSDVVLNPALPISSLRKIESIKIHSKGILNKNDSNSSLFQPEITQLQPKLLKDNKRLTFFLSKKCNQVSGGGFKNGSPTIKRQLEMSKFQQKSMNLLPQHKSINF